MSEAPLNDPASLSDVIDFSNVRFKIELTDAGKADLFAFLHAL
jgi:hypothetical protein